MKFILYIILIIAVCTGGCRHHGEFNEKPIHKTDFGSQWPFTVEKGIIRCVHYHAEDTAKSRVEGIVFITNNKIYPLNAVAKKWGQQFNYADLEEIWLDDSAKIKESINAGIYTHQTKIKIDIMPIVNEATRLCESKE